MSFIWEFWNYIVSSIEVNKYFTPPIPNVWVYFHTLSHNLGTITKLSLFRMFKFLEILKFLNKRFEIFGFWNYSIVYISSYDSCKSLEIS